ENGPRRSFLFVDFVYSVVSIRGEVVPPVAAKSPRILIVDDDASQRSLLNSFLTGQGFETMPVSSGEEALQALRANDISMMITDVRMPGISGLDALRQA